MTAIDDVMRRINTEGCIPTIQSMIERNLYPVGGGAIGVALSQVTELLEVEILIHFILITGSDPAGIIEQIGQLNQIQVLFSVIFGKSYP